MTNDHREAIARACGIIEGVAAVTDERISETLFNALEMIDTVMSEEEQK